MIFMGIKLEKKIKRKYLKVIMIKWNDGIME